jgi:hypothetical protein
MLPHLTHRDKPGTRTLTTWNRPGIVKQPAYLQLWPLSTRRVGYIFSPGEELSRRRDGAHPGGAGPDPMAARMPALPGAPMPEREDENS